MLYHIYCILSSLEIWGKFFFLIRKIWSGDPSGRKMAIITGNIIEIGPRAGVQWLLNVFNMTITLVTVWCQPTFLTLLPTLPCALSFSLMRTIIPKLFSCRHTNWHAPIHSLRLPFSKSQLSPKPQIKQKDCCIWGRCGRSLF